MAMPNRSTLAKNSGPFLLFMSELDDFGLWNRTLSEAEILGLYNTEVQTLGCTDSLACNYDSGADGDDGAASTSVSMCCNLRRSQRARVFSIFGLGKWIRS